MNRMNVDFPPLVPEAARGRPAGRRWARVLGGGLLLAALLGGGLFAVARLWVFPWLGEHPEWVAAELSRASGVPVSIDRLAVDWPGLRPRLRLGGLAMNTGERAVLRLERVEGTLAWMSLLHWMPYFHRLEIVSPEIELGRGKDGVFTVAGIRIVPRAGQGGDPLAWLFGQTHVVVSNATLTWNDELRAAPPLRLEEARFAFRRGLTRHRFEFRARPPANLATVFEADGEVSRYDSAALADISGHLHVGLERADLGGWSAWVDYPFPLSGHGGVQLWLDSDKGAQSASADVSLDGVEIALAPDLPVLRLDRLGGRLQASRGPDGIGFGARSLWLDTAEGKALYPMDFNLQLRQGADAAAVGGAFSAAALDLAALVGLAEYLPLGEEARAYLTGFDPKGRVRQLAFDWEGEVAAPREWSLKADFENIALVARGLVPGMDGISGRIEGDRRTGRFALSGRAAHIDLPRVFEHSRIALASLDAKGGWRRKDGRLELALDGVDFANDDAAGTVSGRYGFAQAGPGELDLVGRLTRAEGGAVWRYIPFVAGPRARDWVKGAIRQGRMSDVKLALKGPMRDFPFRNGEGKFTVAAKASETSLDYAAGWPMFEDIAGELRFDGPGLTVEARSGRVFGVRLAPVRVEIPDLGAGVLSIEGAAKGPGADFMRYIAESPLSKRLRGFPGPLRAEGGGELALSLTIPLREPDATQVSGDYRFAGNRFHLGDSGLVLASAEGEVRFTGESLDIPAIRGRMLGAPLILEGKTGAEGLKLNARGQVVATAARKELGWPLLEWLGGSADWQAELALGRGDDGSRFVVRSGLKGLYSRLPAPFAKEADDVAPLEIVVVSPTANKPRQIAAKLGGWFDAVLEHDAAGKLRGGVGVNRPAAMPAGAGVDVAASLDMLDVDAWQWSLAGSGDGGNVMLPLASVTLDAGRLRAFGRTFKALKLHAVADAEGWKADVESAEAQGRIDWRWAGEGVLSARLRRLELANDEGGNNESGAAPPRSLPGLDVRAEQFIVSGRELGQLEVRASNRNGGWLLDNLTLQRPETQLTGSGLWLAGERRSKLDFTLSTSDAGALAGAMGYAHMVRGGRAKLVGQLGWDGTLTGIDYPTLSGYLDLTAKDGRFERIEPGVGRLLGILSLQALPRRVTLDFRDVFSDGFVFDSIAGNVAVSNGVMRTDSLVIAGPSARVLMHGQADIAAETQDLHVTVRPTLTESVAIGAAVVNPAAGAVAYLAQKVLGDPIEKMFSYDYSVTGNWVDPVVTKTGMSAARPAAAAESAAPLQAAH
ncbi:MAG: TIGR02099 family protein [Azoarcus sp.]|nr:TIGR02099 family protein [Azoarcus sp.]